MQYKKVYISGVEGPGSGSFDWRPDKESFEKVHQSNIDTFSDLPEEIIYSGEFHVPSELEGEAVTMFIEEYLMENGFEDSPLINKKIHNKPK